MAFIWYHIAVWVDFVKRLQSDKIIGQLKWVACDFLPKQGVRMTDTNRLKIATVLSFSIIIAQAVATEYFVSPEGCDSYNGVSPDNAFASVQSGIDALSPGDTLTILPGEYFGTFARDGLGDHEVETTIRAAIPGTAVLRGDLPIGGFQPVPGLSRVYQVHFDGTVNGVIELDTLTLLMPTTSASELQFRSGHYYYDADAAILYISSTDYESVTEHRYSVATADRSGLVLENPVRVTIDGIVTRGYSFKEELDRSHGQHRSRWGIWLQTPRDCVIRNCIAFLNASGIGITSSNGGGHNLVENCTVYANHNPLVNAGGIAVFHANEDVIRNNLVHRSPMPSGLRFYQDGEGKALLDNNIALSGGLQIKGGELNTLGTVRNSVAVGSIEGFIVRDSIVGAGNRHRNQSDSAGSVYTREYDDFDWDTNFVDPLNGDFRLQADSALIGAGENGSDLGPNPYEGDVFFVSPDGKDTHAGTSLTTAWRTLDHALSRLQSGDTLYLSAGHYTVSRPLAGLSATDRPTAVRGRGNDAVIVDGQLLLQDSSAVILARLQLNGSATVKNSSGISITHCVFNATEQAITAEQTKDLAISHNILNTSESPAISLTGCADVSLSGNLFDSNTTPAIVSDSADAITYSDYNSFGSRDVWKIAGDVQNPATFRPGFERHSHFSPVAIHADEQGFLRVDNNLSGGLGPNGLPVGPYAYTVENTAKVAGPVVHSATATTANIEWYVSKPALFLLEWGPSPELGNSIEVPAESFVSYSLTGLEPDTVYYFRLADVAPPDNIRDIDIAGTFAYDDSLQQLRTLTADPVPQTYYVSPFGDNSHSGLSQSSAWQTISHAADLARPGDTVIVGVGHYAETVRIRATGTADKPITFRAANGEEVWFESKDTLERYFDIANKDYIHIDGFRFDAVGRRTSGWALYSAGAIRLFNSLGSRISRCLLDGRSMMYSGPFLVASTCPNLVISNCVIVDNMASSITIANSPDVIIEHCVWFRPKIRGLTVINRPGQMVYVRNNIFTDNLINKSGIPLIAVGRHQTLHLENNGFHLRFPPDQKDCAEVYGDAAYEQAAMAFHVIASPDDPCHPSIGSTVERPSFVEWMADYQITPADNVFGSPDFSVFVEDAELQSKVTSFIDGNRRPEVPRRDFDYLLLGAQLSRKVDFADLIATNPEFVKRKIGLQSVAF